MKIYSHLRRILMVGSALLLSALPIPILAAEYHVLPDGNDANPGTSDKPFRTIQRAADLAQPGDVVTVHQGVYRERVNPPRGGISNENRIVYRAAPGQKVEIKGSEIVKHWEKVQTDVWKTIVPNSFFGKFNPFADLIHGDWFAPKERQHHTGAVYLNGEWLAEAAKLEDVLKPISGDPLWFATVDPQNTTIWAQFKDVNPNDQQVEINVRKTVFYPEKPGVNYLTVQGFILCNAATPWAPPTAEQIGLIGTHWSKGWIIENNTISHSVCSGIALGKHGDQWDNTSADTAEGYVMTIERAMQNGWAKENIGHHLVRNNVISHCEQTGIVGSLGAAFSAIADNVIHDIHVRQLFTGAEMAGIKFHGAIDVQIVRNHIHHSCLGLWLDWMAQGTRVSGNLFHDNSSQDLFVEVNHGPFVVANNLFLSPTSVLVASQGGAYIHNLFGGRFIMIPYDSRMTPFHKAHSTELAGMHDNPLGDDRFYNNIFVQNADLTPFDKAQLPLSMDGNVFLKDCKPSKHEKAPLMIPDYDAGPKLVEKADGLYLEIKLDNAWTTQKTRSLVTTSLLGKSKIAGLPYEYSDGSPLKIEADYLNKRRNESNPAPGPIENWGDGSLSVKVW
jgi:alpha-L-arabinofuranosidase